MARNTDLYNPEPNKADYPIDPSELHELLANHAAAVLTGKRNADEERITHVLTRCLRTIQGYESHVEGLQSQLSHQRAKAAASPADVLSAEFASGPAPEVVNVLKTYMGAQYRDLQSKQTQIDSAWEQVKTKRAEINARLTALKMTQSLIMGKVMPNDRDEIYKAISSATSGSEEPVVAAPPPVIPRPTAQPARQVQQPTPTVKPQAPNRQAVPEPSAAALSARHEPTSVPPQVSAPVAQPSVPPQVSAPVAQPSVPPQVSAPVAQPSVPPQVSAPVAQPSVPPQVSAPVAQPSVAQPPAVTEEASVEEQQSENKGSGPRVFIHTEDEVVGKRFREDS